MALELLGNNVGYVYVTDPSNNIIAALPNNSYGAADLLAMAMIAAPLSSGSIASGAITITSAGNITNVTVNGVSIMGVVAASSGSVVGLATDLTTKINSTISSPDYTASSRAGVGGAYIVTLQAASGTGSAPNGFVVTPTFTNGAAGSATNMTGGSAASGVYSTGFNGRRFYLYADNAAITTSISGASEITALIVNSGFQNPGISQSATIASNAITVQRETRVSEIIVDTSGGGATDTLTTIDTTGYNNLDVIIVRGANGARVTTITNANNIILANGVSFATGDTSNSIQLQYLTSVNKWVEIFRTPGLNFTTASIRGAGIPQAAYGTHEISLATSGTTTLIPGTDKGIQIVSGSPVLVGSIVITAAGSPIDGDQWNIIWKATPTVGGNTVTIFGKALTATQAASGKVNVRAVYDAVATAYSTVVLDDFSAVDYATVANVAAKENSLGNPAADGYYLSSTAAGTRSWVPPITASVQTATITLSSAQILTGHSVPIQVVAAQGAGTVIVPISPIYAKRKYGSAQYVGAGLMEFVYGSSTIAFVTTNAFLTGAADLLTIYPLATPVSSPIANTALNFVISTGDPTVGDSTFQFTFYYIVVNTI